MTPSSCSVSSYSPQYRVAALFAIVLMLEAGIGRAERAAGELDSSSTALEQATTLEPAPSPAPDEKNEFHSVNSGELKEVMKHATGIKATVLKVEHQIEEASKSAHEVKDHFKTYEDSVDKLKGQLSTMDKGSAEYSDKVVNHFTTLDEDILAPLIHGSAEVWKEFVQKRATAPVDLVADAHVSGKGAHSEKSAEVQAQSKHSADAESEVSADAHHEHSADEVHGNGTAAADAKHIDEVHSDGGAEVQSNESAQAD